MSAETAPTTIGLESAPLTPAEAEAKLNELTADTEAGRAWSAKWLGGNPGAVAEFRALVEAKNAKPAGGDFLSRVINGTAELPLVDTHHGGLTVRNQMFVANRCAILASLKLRLGSTSRARPTVRKSSITPDCTRRSELVIRNG